MNFNFGSVLQAFDDAQLPILQRLIDEHPDSPSHLRTAPPEAPEENSPGGPRPVVTDPSQSPAHNELRRHLLAANNEPQKALQHTLDVYRWRREVQSGQPPNVVQTAEQEGQLLKEIGQGKFSYLGQDADRRPVVLVRAATHFPEGHAEGLPRESTLRTQMLALFRLMRISATSPAPKKSSSDGAVVAVVDMFDFGWANVDKGIGTAESLLLETVHPGALHRVYVVRAPVIVQGIWMVVSQVMPQQWVERIIFLSDEKSLPEQSGISPTLLPSALGGCLEWTPQQDAEWRTRTVDFVLKGRDPKECTLQAIVEQASGQYSATAASFLFGM